MPQLHQRYQLLINFLAPKIRHELVFRVPIFFQVFLIIRFFRFPAGFIPSNRRQYKAAKLTILKRFLRQHLYESGCSNLQMPKWWNNSYPLHRHRFLEAISNHGCFKPWTFKLLYSTAIHGFSNLTFHRLCDQQGPTMTIMKLNGKIVVAFVEKSWDTQDALNLGYQKDRSCKMFHITSTGEIVKLRCRGFYNSHSSGPDFKFLPINLTVRDTSCFFPENNEFITGYKYYSFARIDSVVVLKMRIFF